MIRSRIRKVVEDEIIADVVSTPTTLGIEEIKTYKDEAILVLNLLEKEGINIYDENNYPGMYLRGNKQKTLSENLKAKFTQSSNNNNNDNSQNLNNLFEHLKNKKQ